VSEHGPHVDKSKFAEASFVTLKVFLPGIGKSATITRNIANPKKPKIEPADNDVMAALAEIGDHPEITLSRREILRFILVEPTKRSEEIQTILKLDKIGQIRSALNTAQNRLQRSLKTADAQVQSDRAALQRHLQIATLRTEDLLAAANARRSSLGLSAIAELTADTTLDSGLATNGTPADINMATAARDVKALADASQLFPDLARTAASAIVADLRRLEADPSLAAALRRRTFIETGIAFLDGPDCPLCDTSWPDERHLRDHLAAKLAKSEEAKKLQESLLTNGTVIIENATRIAGLTTPVHALAAGLGEPALAKSLADWKTALGALKLSMTTVDGIASIRDRLVTSWLDAPTTLSKGLEALTEKIAAKPDQTATIAAQTFLTTAQLRLGDYREAQRIKKASELAWQSAKVAYESYCAILEDELNALYEDVQKDFSTFYRAINDDDESTFTAKLTPVEGSLGLDVNFYGRGLFPPAAYHSEGHQDGMGVCLYLALMKRLFADQFTFALLDDVVMSVDSSHRYQFCKLLKTYFPDTQFIITTHDRLWAEQMKSAGLVTAKTSVAFHSWTIDGGPLVESNQEIWDEVGAALSKGKVDAAAAALRHHLEYASRHLADQLGATPPFHADGNYELGELLPSVLKRMRDLCGKAADVAQSWGKTEDRDAAGIRKTMLSTSSGAMNVEQWAINKAVHYNEWANFGRRDFEPVVDAFRELLDCFRCKGCDSWLYVTPRANPESLRCMCNTVSFNLKAKPK